MVIDLNGVKGLAGAFWKAPAKPCDFCKTGASSVFCRVDSVFLCLSCDANIHDGANKLASRHDRVSLCDVCEQAAAAVTCKADAAALCVTCDADIHSANPLAQRHERVPVQPFFASAESSAFNFLLVPNDTTSHHCSDDASYGGSSHHHHQDEVETPASLLIPNPDANSQAMLFSETDDPFLNFEYQKSIDYSFQHHHHSAGGADSVVPVQTKPVINHHLSEINWFSSFNYPSRSHDVSSTSVEAGVVPDGYSNGVKVEPTQLCGMDRKARVLRYREKRKNRKFEKTIRYASRKAYAETRPRVKGRFAKRTETGAETNCLYGTAASAMNLRDSQYGVVPTF